MLRAHVLTSIVAAFTARALPAGAFTQPEAERGLAFLDTRGAGRLGVYAFDTATGREMGHRAHERFPMCSTFKLLLVGNVLARVDAGNEDLKRLIAIADADILAYAPVTAKYLARGSMSVEQLCAATIEWSDNTAANLLLHSMAGPSAVTRFARTLGDGITRLDRNEPAVNTAIPGDPRDTTTPYAMAHNMQKLVLGTALKPPSRARLKAWLIGSRTGKTKLQANMPKTWTVGDKTGSGENATTNDVAIAWPPNRAPIIVAAYFTGSTATGIIRDGTLPAVGLSTVLRFGT